MHAYRLTDAHIDIYIYICRCMWRCLSTQTVRFIPIYLQAFHTLKQPTFHTQVLYPHNFTRFVPTFHTYVLHPQRICSDDSAPSALLCTIVCSVYSLELLWATVYECMLQCNHALLCATVYYCLLFCTTVFYSILLCRILCYCVLLFTAVNRCVLLS